MKSIFTRLLLTILITGILINILVSGFFRYYVEHTGAKNIRQIFQKYTVYIINDIGFPPDKKRASEIVSKSKFSLKIEGPGFYWESSPMVVPKKTRHFKNILYKDI